MSVLFPMAATALTIAAFAMIAEERFRAYRLNHAPLDLRAFALAALVTLTRGWLALRGIGGIDTSVVFAVATVSALTDLRCGYVFDRVLLAGGTALIAIEASHGRLGAAIAGSVAGASAMAVPWVLTRARGMGLGDVKLAAVLGCALGPQNAMRALWFAFVIGAPVAVAAVGMRRHRRERSLPFAPFLALGTVLSSGGAAW